MVCCVPYAAYACFRCLPWNSKLVWTLLLSVLVVGAHKKKEKYIPTCVFYVHMYNKYRMMISIMLIMITLMA